MRENWNQFKILLTRFRDLTSLSVATIVTNGIGAIFWLYMASLLGTDDYGMISYMISIGVMTSTIALSGMSNVLIVYGAKNVKIQSTIFMICFISSGISSIVLFFFIVKDIPISLYVIGSVIFTLIVSDLIGQKLFIKYSKIIILQKLLMVGISITLYHLIGVQGVILGISLSFLSFSFLIYKTIKNTKVDFSIFKTRYKFTANSFLLDITNAFKGSLDKIIIAPMLGFSLLGNYQLGLQFISILNIIPGMLFTYILSHDSSGVSTRFVKKIIIIVSIIFVIASITLSPIFVPMLFPKFVHAIGIIQIMSIEVIPSSITSIYISRYLGQTNSKIVIIGSGSYLITQIVTLMILGNMYGLNGAAASIVISAIVHLVYFVSIDLYDKKSNQYVHRD